MTEPAVPEGTSARAGAKLVEGQQKAPDEAIVEASEPFMIQKYRLTFMIWA